MDDIEEMTIPMLTGMLKASANLNSGINTQIVGNQALNSKSPVPSDFFGKKTRNVIRPNKGRI